MAGGNLDLSGFVTPTQTYGGLNNITATLEKNKILAQQEQDRQERLANQAEAKRNATATYLQGYLNPKHFLTGTNYDPVITQGVSGILQKAMQLASQGVDAPTITMAINPDVSDLSKASQNIQSIDAKRDEAFKVIGKDPGIDADKFNDAYRNAAFYTTDAKGNKVLKDMSTLDPTNADAITNNVLTNADIYTNGGLNNFMKTAKPEVNDFNSKVRDASGRITQVKGVQTSAPFMQPDLDQNGVYTGKFVPKYEIATDGDSPLLHTFKDDKGNDVKAPVRMVTEDVFNSLPASAQGYIMQEVRKQIAEHPEIKLNSPQAEHLGRAIAYDEMKNSPDNWSTYKRTDVNMQPLPPRISIYNGTQAPPTIDLYNGDKNNVGLKQIVDEDKSNGFDYTRFAKAPQQAQTTLIKQARDISGDKSINNTNLYFKPNDVGDIELMQIVGDKPDAKKDVSLMTVDPLTLNIPANQNVAKVGTGKTKPVTIGNVIKTGEGAKQKTGTGMSDADYENFLKKNKLK